MPEAVQTRQRVQLTTEKGTVLFSIKENMLPGHLECATVFCGDDFESKFPGDEHEMLRALCCGLLPEERCTKIEFVFIIRDKLNTDFKLVCAADEPSSSVCGRADAALRVCGFAPIHNTSL